MALERINVYKTSDNKEYSKKKDAILHEREIKASEYVNTCKETTPEIVRHFYRSLKNIFNGKDPIE